ncbi:MAG: zinc ribbon domain-containing protein [Spirulina sp.]
MAEKSGKLVLEVDPKHSSQECSHCGYISPNNRDREKFLCESCGYHDDADIQASVNILHRGLKTLRCDPAEVSSAKERAPREGISPSQLWVVPAKVTLEPELTGSSETGTEKSVSVGTDEPGNPRTGEWVQLSLFA